MFLLFGGDQSLVPRNATEVIYEERDFLALSVKRLPIRISNCNAYSQVMTIYWYARLT